MYKSLFCRVYWIWACHLNRNIEFDKAKDFHSKTTERTAKSGTLVAQIGGTPFWGHSVHVSKLVWCHV